MIDTTVLKQRIDSYILARDEFNKDFEFRMSTAGFCPRLLDYMAQRGLKKPDIRGAMRMLTGEPIHAFWRMVFTDLFGEGYKYVEQEVRFEIEDGDIKFNVLGHPDGYIQEFDAVTEVKSVSDSTFQMVVNQGHPIPTHVEQGNIYAQALKAAWVLFIYHNRDSGDYELFFVPHSEDMVDRTVDKWVGVAKRKLKGELHPRPYNDMTASPCFYCDYKAECYEGFSQEVARFFDIESTHMTDYALALEAVSRRSDRLLAEKLEEKAKESIAKWMMGHQAKMALVKPEGAKPLLVTLKIGKNNNPLVDVKEKT